MSPLFIFPICIQNYHTLSTGQIIHSLTSFSLSESTSDLSTFLTFRDLEKTEQAKIYNRPCTHCSPVDGTVDFKSCTGLLVDPVLPR